MQCGCWGGRETPNPLLGTSGKLNSNPGCDDDLLVALRQFNFSLAQAAELRNFEGFSLALKASYCF